MPTASTNAAVTPTLEPVQGLASRPLCSSAYRLVWRHPGSAQAFAIERAGDCPEDRDWRAAGQVPGSARDYESVGLLGGGGRSWRHRVRPLGEAGAAGPWTEIGGAPLPDAIGGPRGARLIAASALAPRNISGSFIALADGTLLYGWTASANLDDNAPSWIQAIARRPDGSWEERGTLFPSERAWTCVSRPSFARLSDGGILATYSIGRAIVAGAHDGATSHFSHRYVARISRDETRTWSDPRIISDDRFPFEMGNSNGTRTMVLANGRVLTNVHCCKPSALADHDPFQGKDAFNEVMGTYLLISDDDARTWRRVPADPDSFFFVSDDPYGRKRIGFWEIAVVEHAREQLLMYGRNASGWLFETRSRDAGATWSPLARTSIPYPHRAAESDLHPRDGDDRTSALAIRT